MSFRLVGQALVIDLKIYVSDSAAGATHHVMMRAQRDIVTVVGIDQLETLDLSFLRRFREQSVDRRTADAGKFFLNRLVHHSRRGVIVHTAKDVLDDSLLQSISFLIGFFRCHFNTHSLLRTVLDYIISYFFCLSIVFLNFFKKILAARFEPPNAELFLNFNIR